MPRHPPARARTPTRLARRPDHNPARNTPPPPAIVSPAGAGAGERWAPPLGGVCRASHPPLMISGCWVSLLLGVQGFGGLVLCCGVGWVVRRLVLWVGVGCGAAFVCVVGVCVAGFG